MSVDIDKAAARLDAKARRAQLRARETQHRWRGHNFYPPQALAKKIPGLGTTDGQGMNATVWLHYFQGGCDWWVTEWDQETGEAFGYADMGGAELGYIYLPDLEAARGHLGMPVERDLYWTPKPLQQVVDGRWQ